MGRVRRREGRRAYVCVCVGVEKKECVPLLIGTFFSSFKCTLQMSAGEIAVGQRDTGECLCVCVCVRVGVCVCALGGQSGIRSPLFLHFMRSCSRVVPRCRSGYSAVFRLFVRIWLSLFEIPASLLPKWRVIDIAATTSRLSASLSFPLGDLL